MYHPIYAVEERAAYEMRLPVVESYVWELKDHGIKSVEAIGDCYVPGTIAAAVYSGHLYARQLDNSVDQSYGFLRENYQSQVL